MDYINWIPDIVARVVEATVIKNEDITIQVLTNIKDTNVSHVKHGLEVARISDINNWRNLIMSLSTPEEKPVYFEFIKRDDSYDEVIKVGFNVSEDITWHELVEYFNRFLCACGYIPKEYNQFVKAIESDE